MKMQQLSILLQVAICTINVNINQLNSELVVTLSALVQTTLFKYFKVNLHKDCLFWNEQQLCNLKDCSVIESQEDVLKTNRKYLPNTKKIDCLPCVPKWTHSA